MTSVAQAGTASAVRPVSIPLLDRVASGVVTAVPPIMLGVVMWFGWSGNLLDWKDLLVLAVSYVVIGTGVTVGFHRLLTHRSFKGAGTRAARISSSASTRRMTCTNDGERVVCCVPGLRRLVRRLRRGR